ncbi:MAG: sensor histidine kinase [Chloroflexota bacterium]
MHVPFIVQIYFFYGLAFFCMGLIVVIEGGRASDERLRKALRPLAGFGILHGGHEWFEMFIYIDQLASSQPETVIIDAIRLIILAVSFVSLAAFGSFLLAQDEQAQRYYLLVPLMLEAVWVFGLMVLHGKYSSGQIWAVGDVWTRYTLAIPAGLLTAAGLVVQQRYFRRAGLIRFGQDALWAAVAFLWYGLVGQIFVQRTALPPSTILNADLFMRLFGIPVQLFRAVMAVMAAVFIVRFLRAFQVETDLKIAELQAARLHDAQARERLRGELFRRVVGAQEAERQRIARDLHDETGQSLTAIGMGLRGLEKHLENSTDSRKDQSMNNLRALKSMAEKSLEELQRIITDLRPSHLDDLGLTAAIRWYATTVQERTNLFIKVTGLGDEHEISPPAKIALFRVAQEALNNIVKHAQASEVHIALSYETDVVRLKVRDNGRGFLLRSVNQGQGRISLGLAGMEERANLLGGSFNIVSSPGEGTIIQVSIPYNSEEDRVIKTIQGDDHEHSTAAG